MSNLSSKIQEDLKSTLKESLDKLGTGKNQEKISTLRMLIAEIKNEEIAKKKRGALDDAEIQAVVSRQVKRHKDSIESYKTGGRADLVQKEEGELKILQSYLPKQAGTKEIEKIIDAAIAKTGAASPSDFGKVMGMVMKQLKGKADGNAVSAVVKKKLKSS